jgi:hypothetical protein
MDVGMGARQSASISEKGAWRITCNRSGHHVKPKRHPYLGHIKFLLVSESDASPQAIHILLLLHLAYDRKLEKRFGTRQKRQPVAMVFDPDPDPVFNFIGIVGFSSKRDILAV